MRVTPHFNSVKSQSAQVFKELQRKVIVASCTPQLRFLMWQVSSKVAAVADLRGGHQGRKETELGSDSDGEALKVHHQKDSGQSDGLENEKEVGGEKEVKDDAENVS